MVSFCSAAIALAGAIQKWTENAFSISKSIFSRITTQTECKKVALKYIKDSWIDR